MSNCMPKEQREYIEKIQKDCLESTNMTESEAYSFAFRCWQMDYIKADAIEKTIAKKPKVIIHDEDVRIGRILFKKGVKTYKCVCESWITFLQDYCSCCGQKLDWSEVE